ncbi:AAA family ATPase [Salmonella enterica]|uniref:Anticodon nuclease n=1 Tax=Salmonella enterica TaxID=28901 RepID=A0A2T8TGC6_SALER|nr:AAA family ATPase [Salmonella enterica]EAW2101464.1 anticodon nuclease [Salmonella enterica subsp. enterica]ECU8002655.1 anticodon nuclease [Salmonella enterica subsp. enterica serovar O rough]EDM7278360.1 anticodon nuclease [Salmonella enterica subsp. enterica serovar Enteritidis]EDO6547025.1 AAA family ATPase [Salmonella enterica subsp. enterica serovar 4,[5],12:i:-]EDT1538136.1 AAA family ATPase [Salmonella enterica subsp. enterica serovar Javiana]EEJ3249852.1 AAA family ATPase [Salmone
MSKTLTEIAQQLKNANKKVQLIYAFNGTGKTRLSREFKQHVTPENDGDEVEQSEPSRNKFLYYNAFTEDLFYWDNELEQDAEPRLRIQPNSFTDWVLKDQGQDRNIITNFQRYANEKLTPRFNEEYKVKGKDDKEITVKAFSEVTFSLERGDDEHSGNLKISKGEESNFIWSIFYTLIEQVIDILNVAEPSDRETNVFDQLEYVFIDDPVSSLDENHLIELAVDLAQLIKSNNSDVKFIITTHNPLFYNVLHNELNSDDGGYKKKWLDKYRMTRLDDGTFQLVQQPNDSPFSYHLYLKSELEKAIESGQLSKYHFNFLRNILEKTSTFLGYKKWGDLLPKTDDGKTNPYEARIINISSHSKHAGEEVADLTEDDKRVLRYLVNEINTMYRFQQAEN